MAEKTGIAWTERTWNPTVGCHHKSPGCDRCYAERQHDRNRSMSSKKYTEPFSVVKPWEAALDEPLRVKKPSLWFVNSMSDLFHAALPFEYIKRVFDVMERAHWHTFQVLTKRSERLPSMANRLPWPDNVWMGVSIENQDYAYRAKNLLEVPAKIRFVSAEPLLGPLTLFPYLGPSDISWVIVGGESQPGCRPMDLDWVRDLREECLAFGADFFLKQLGGWPSKRAHENAVLDGRTWTEMPSGFSPSRNPQPELLVIP